MRGGHIRHQRSPVEAAVQSVPPDVFFPKHKSISSSGSSKKVFEGNKSERLTALVIVGMWSSTSCLK